MPGMKRDCGGAAALLGAFKATVEMVSGLLQGVKSIYIIIQMSVIHILTNQIGSLALFFLKRHEKRLKTSHVTKKKLKLF